MARKFGQRDMRRKFQRTRKVRLADEVAEVVIARRILRIEREPVDGGRAGPETGIRRPFPRRTGHREHGPDDGLHAHIEAGLGKGDAAIKPVAIGDRRRRKAPLCRRLGNRLGIDRAVEHRVGGEDTKRNERGVGHLGKLGPGG